MMTQIQILYQIRAINKMKKTPSSQSLLHSRRSSIQKTTVESNQKSVNDKQKPENKQQVPSTSSVVRNVTLQSSTNPPPLKSDIKQIYEYKIKQRANKSKLVQKSKEPQKSKQSQLHDRFEEKEQNMESLKLENQKMSRELCDLFKENKKLKELLIGNGQASKCTKGKDEKLHENAKDYKKQMLNKLNDRQRIHTQMASSFAGKSTNIDKQKVGQSHHIGTKVSSTNKQKNSGSKSKLRQSSSRNSITMNLNMSFVKIKSPSTTKNAENKQPAISKERIQKMIRSNSTKHFITYKQDKMKNDNENQRNDNKGNDRNTRLLFNSLSDTRIKSLFDSLAQKSSINIEDLEQFYSLNKKIFSHFNEIFSLSKHTFTQMINKINIAECYESKRLLHESKRSTGQNTKMKKVLDEIHELYRRNNVTGQNDRHANYTCDYVHEDDNKDSSGKRYNISQIDPNEHDTPASSLMSFTQSRNNPERQKSHEKYRLKKLNENLDLIANFENKKLRTEITEPGTTQPKVYFSKPISTHVSRKISFNNSLNNSLKNSKFVE